MVVDLELAGAGNCGAVLRRTAAEQKTAMEKWKREGAREERLGRRRKKRERELIPRRVDNSKAEEEKIQKDKTLLVERK